MIIIAARRWENQLDQISARRSRCALSRRIRSENGHGQTYLRDVAGLLFFRVNLVKTGAPSRAEITDATMGERAECVMLNKGPHLVQAVHVLDDILCPMETHQSKKSARLRPLHLSAHDAWRCTRRRLESGFRRNSSILGDQLIRRAPNRRNPPLGVVEHSLGLPPDRSPGA
jgi:hypothetical protein